MKRILRVIFMLVLMVGIMSPMGVKASEYNTEEPTTAWLEEHGWQKDDDCYTKTVDGVNYKLGNFSNIYDKEYYWQVYVTGSNYEKKLLTIPENIDGYVVTTISRGAFNGNKTIEEVKLPDSLLVITEYAFKNCTSLTKVYIPKNVISDADYFGTASNYSPFVGCLNLKEVEFQEGITTIPKAIFAGTGLESIRIPDTVTTIEHHAFANCDSLTDVVYSKNLATISKGAFRDCDSLTEAILPESLTFIGEWVFASCDSLEKAYIPNKLESDAKYYDYTDSNYGSFADCLNLKEVEFQEGITTIPKAIFAGTGLESIRIPDTVTTISNYAFANCDSLTDVVYSKNLATIGKEAFYDCDSLTEAKLPESLTLISELAFAYCDSLGKAYIPKKLESDAKYYDYTDSNYGSFVGCLNLKEVEFQEGITTIPQTLFAGTGLEQITIPDTVKTIKSHAFVNCDSLREVNLPESLTTIGDGVFYVCDGLPYIDFPESLVTIGEATFAGCDVLETVNLPERLTKIGKNTFANCPSFKGVQMENVSEIGDYAFYNCDSLTEIELPETLAKLGTEVFYDCDNLKSIRVPSATDSMGKYIFADCDKLEDVYLGNGLKTIPEGAFKTCESLKDIILPYNIEKIEKSAFLECIELSKIVIPKRANSIHSDVFSYHRSMTIYGVAGSNAETYADANDIEFVPIDVTADSIELLKKKVVLEAGQKSRILYYLEPMHFTGDVIFTSKDTSVATVDTDGVIKAVKAGNTIITIQADDVIVEREVEVVVPIQKINIKEESIEIDKNGSYQLSVSISPSTTSNKSLIWTSSNENVATVKDGKVIAMNVGTTTITVSNEKNTVSDTCTVVVVKKDFNEIFSDVYNDWYIDYVKFVYENKLMTGISGTDKFQPNSNITKAQVAQVLFNMAGQPIVSDYRVYDELKDVHSYDWFADAVAWAYNNGVVTGDSNTKMFNPNADVTREQLAIMMYRYADYKGYDVSQTSDLAGLKNAENVSNWALDGVKWAVGSGMISGIDKGGVKDLAPQGTATRAQMAAILQRFCEGYGL